MRLLQMPNAVRLLAESMPTASVTKVHVGVTTHAQYLQGRCDITFSVARAWIILSHSTVVLCI